MSSKFAVLCCGAFLLLLAAGCSPDETTGSDITVDSCGTRDPLSSTDSARQLWPQPFYIVDGYREIHSVGKAIGLASHIGYNEILPYSGVFIRDLRSGAVKMFPGWSYDIRPQKDRVLISSSKGVMEVDLSTNEIVNSIPGYVNAIYANDGNGYFLYAHRRHLLWMTAGDTAVIDREITESRVLNDTTLVVVKSSGLYLYNLLQGTERRLQLPLPSKIFYPYVQCFDLNKTTGTLLLENWAGIGDDRTGGLYLVDIYKETVRLILDAPYWPVDLEPTWSEHGTFFVTQYCRKDSAAMVYEYNLSGKMIRKVTDKTMRYF